MGCVRGLPCLPLVRGGTAVLAAEPPKTDPAREALAGRPTATTLLSHVDQTASGGVLLRGGHVVAANAVCHAVLEGHSEVSVLFPAMSHVLKFDALDEQA